MGLEGQGADVIDGNIVVEDRLQGRSLEFMHTSLIKPSSPTPIDKEWLSLANLDLMWLPFYTPLICTYTLKDHNFESSTQIVQHLKDSLTNVLVYFYPLAGKVVSKDGITKIHCNDEGAVFTEASIDAELTDLKTDDFQPLRLLSGMGAAGLGSYPPLPKLPNGLPALIIQVTHFKCGGISLAANWAHPVADGHSGFHFMKSWSEIARGEQISVLPDHRRELAKPRNLPSPSNALKTVVISPEAQKEPSAAHSDQATDASENSQVSAKQSKTISKTFEYTKEEIERLKKLAMIEDATLHLTRADCLSAHLWRTITRARSLPGHARIRYWVLVEGRKKLSLPPGYFGNVIGMGSAMTTVSELLNDPFSSTANLIHSAIAYITAEWFQDFIDWIQIEADLHRNSHIVSSPLPAGCEWGASYLNRFPFYELDFGFGIPAHSTRNTMGAWDGLVFIVPSAHSLHNLVAIVNLDSDVMPSFASIAHDIPEHI